MKHLIIIGFKNVGKSTVGRNLSVQLQMPFIDLDDEIADLYFIKNSVELGARQILKKHGEEYFRKLETEALMQAIQEQSPSILSLGGGAPLAPENQKYLEGHIVFYLDAKPETVYERMVKNGLPSFFPKDEDPEKYFRKLWKERVPVYKKISTFVIDNNHSVEETIEAIKDQL